MTAISSGPERSSDDSTPVSRATDASQAQVSERYGQPPLSFVPNQGQTDPQVKFTASGPGHALFLTANEAVMTLRKDGDGRTPREAKNLSSSQRATLNAKPQAVLRMKWAGAQAAPQVEGREELPGKSNYFIGKNSERWRTNIPNYARVQYSNVYVVLIEQRALNYCRSFFRRAFVG